MPFQLSLMHAAQDHFILSLPRIFLRRELNLPSSTLYPHLVLYAFALDVYIICSTIVTLDLQAALTVYMACS
jgi:hypothetical protein